MFYENPLTGEFGISFEEAKKRSMSSASKNAREIGPFKAYDFSPPPTFNRIVQEVVERRPVNGVQVWEVIQLSEPVIQENVSKFKQDLIEEINALRDQKETEGFRFQNKIFQSDERSASRIANAALTASTALSTSQPFSVDWVAEDNTIVTLDATGVLSLQASLTQRAATLHYYARSLKDSVTSAADIQALEAIDIDQGWPEP